jgi:hypothetical protein
VNLFLFGYFSPFFLSSSFVPLLRSFKAGWLPAIVGPPWPVQYCGDFIAGGVKPSEFDSFMELIAIDEVSRCGSGSVMFALLIALAVGLPPIINFGSKFLQDKVSRPILFR